MDEDEAFERAPRRVRLGVGAAVAAVVIALAATVGFGVLRTAGQSGAEPIGAASASVRAAPVYVHVSGAVTEPGLYVLHADARVVDAVAAAGGLTPDAVVDAVNLARAVSDGEQLVVPSTEGATPGSSVAAAPVDDRIDLNAASAADLEKLPRIGPALAERILTWRDENGRFTNVDDLSMVSGIGPKLLETLRPLVRV